MRTLSPVPKFDEWKSRGAACGYIPRVSRHGENVFLFDAPIESGNIIDYLRYLGSLLESGNTIPDEVLHDLRPEMASLLVTHFAPPGSLRCYTPSFHDGGNA